MRPGRVRVFWLLLLVVALGLGYRHYRRSHAQHKRALVMSDHVAVGILGKALQEYADHHGGNYPATLDELAGIAFESNVLYVPSLSELSGESQRFVYRSGCNVTDKPVRILVYPPPQLQREFHPSNIVLVVMTDGTVRKCMTYAEFEELLTVQAKIPTTATSPTTEPAP